MTKLSKKSRAMLFLALILIVGVYLVPVWKINLKAPQYPEGLGLYIWMNDITGQNPHDLTKINQLNHYIGMKSIVPAEIPEFTFMPFVFGAVGLLCALALLSGSKRIAKIWIVSFFLFGALGFLDFYRWSYDYGHNLDPNAPIKVPGMSYQPPLLGTKLLLNFEASSLPGPGAFMAGTSFILGVLAIVLSKNEVND